MNTISVGGDDDDDDSFQCNFFDTVWPMLIDGSPWILQSYVTQFLSVKDRKQSIATATVLGHQPT